jgi:PAS domain S-box-containing protein
MKHQRRFSDILFVIIIAFLAIASVISYQRITKQNIASRLVVHTNLVKYKIGQILNFIKSAENRLQDSIRARDADFYIQLQKDSSNALGQIQELELITRGDPDQEKRIGQFRSLISGWLGNLREEYQQTAGRMGDLSTYVLTGQTLMNRIQLLTIEMRHAEDELLLQKIQEKDRTAFLTPLYSLVFSFLAILFVTGAYFRLRNETRLRKEAEYGRTVIHNFFHQAPAMLAILKGPKHIFEFVNPPFMELIGGRNPVNLPAREAVPEAAEQGYFEILDNVYKTGNPFIGKEMPLMIEKGNGLVNIYISFICQSIKNASGEADGILVFCYDVTGQVLARKQLEEAENRSRLAIEAARIGTFDWDLQNQQFTSSERLVEIFGYRESEKVTHQDLINRFHPDDKPIRDEAVNNSFSLGSLKYEVRIIWPDQSIHWINVYGKIFTDDARNILRMYGTVVDITPQKQFMQELERKVYERTHSLNHSNLALKQTVSELEQTNAELASFNYIASHDLQEPLRKIIAFSRRIGEVDQEVLSAASRDYFNRIINAASRMQNLIDAFLSYSQTSHLPAEFESTDFNQVIREVHMDFSETIGQKNISLTFSPLPVLMAIPLQVNQLFTNLIGNAIKYTRGGINPVIHVFAEEMSGRDLPFEDADPSTTYWKISVQDNGIGFDQVYEKQIFELFQRLHSRQDYAGTGIGLAICKKIMRNHKGFVAAEGLSGSGSTFSMFFPAG